MSDSGLTKRQILVICLKTVLPIVCSILEKGSSFSISLKAAAEQDNCNYDMYHKIQYTLQIGNMGHSTFILNPTLQGKFIHSVCHNIF